ncbi:polysaccharide deacetylase family protein [Sphingorhabdus contaminans]|uniref:polysaccharide deacetylase family protein n=1 Tax=Sphingorhabdus contaminans TaxID=1343899 RepID=UPI003D28FBEF
MALDPAYLDYPNRRYGYDHQLYDWSAIQERKPVLWPDGKTVALWVCVSLEWFPIVPGDTPFRAPGHMQTAYPDYRHYTARDYGNRVGVYRMLDSFSKTGIKASFATNSTIAERYPALVADIVREGHEIIAHSTDMNGTIATGLAIDDEHTLIVSALDMLERATGTRPKGWLSIARSQSWNTVDLLKEAGLCYCCDWVNDELPWRFNNGLINLPLNHELSDRQIITVQQQSAESYAQSMRDACEWLAGEQAGRLLPLHLTPYIMALPYRIGALESLLEDLVARPEVWNAAGDAIVDAWEAQA